MQSQYSYNIKDNDDIKFLLAYIRKMQNIVEVKVLVIDKIISLTKVTISEKKPDINIRKMWVI